MRTTSAAVIAPRGTKKPAECHDTAGRIIGGRVFSYDRLDSSMEFRFEQTSDNYKTRNPAALTEERIRSGNRGSSLPAKKWASATSGIV